MAASDAVDSIRAVTLGQAWSGCLFQTENYLLGERKLGQLMYTDGL